MTHRIVGTGGHYPGLFLTIENKRDLNRLGLNQKVPLKIGDLIMCAEHAGDCFWDYYLVQTIKVQTRMGICTKYRLARNMCFSSYTLGTPYKIQPSKTEFHKLMGADDGKYIALKADK